MLNLISGNNKILMSKVVINKPGLFHRVLLVLFAVMFIIDLLGQDAGQKVISNFDIYRQGYLQEKIFVHSDKEIYITGEICWFKIYNVDAYHHKLSAVSKIVYVEVMDTANRSVLQAKVEMTDGTGNGSFLIPSNIGSGNYILRAYTSLMKNAGAAYFFEKQITIVNPGKNDWQKPLPKNNNYEVAFFPEGGNLLIGVENRVGFKVNDQYGRGLDFIGLLLNDHGDTVLQFQPFKFGMGSFSFTPQVNTTYTAFVLVPGAQQQQKELPKPSAQGFAMRIDDKQGTVQVTVLSAGQPGQVPVFLFVHTRNIIKVAETGTLKDGQLVFNIDKSKLGDGISHFTVFNQYNEPVCERLYFKKPMQSLLIDPVTDRDYYQQRKKITVDISASVNENKVNAANLSVAVYRLDTLSRLDDESITSYLLMNADLKGSVESPGWYLDNNNDSAAKALDNLVLTQGWRRFKWQEVMTGKKAVLEFLPELYAHTVTGKLSGGKKITEDNEPIGYLAAPGTLTQFKSAQSGADALVKFEMKNFYTNGNVVAQTNYVSDSTYQLNIESPFSSWPAAGKPAPVQLSGKQEALLQSYVSSQVQNAYLTGRLNNFSAPAIDTIPFYGKADESYLLDNYVRFTTIEEVLREYVPSVLVRRSGSSFSLPVIDHGTKFLLPGSPLLLIDGVPIFDFDNFILYDAQKFRKLEVVDRRYISGATIYNGILNFTSYKGDVGNFQLNPHAVMIDYEGLQLKREFYSPLYDTQEKIFSRLPDFRTTLFWAPEIHTDTNGKAQLIFYSSDLPGKYAMVIQGITPDGTTGKSVVFFRVNQP